MTSPSIQKSIVLLDDTEDQLDLCGDTLRRAFSVVPIRLTAHDPSLIVDQIAALQPRPDAILLDVFRDSTSSLSADRTFLPFLTALRQRFGGGIPIFALTRGVSESSVDLVVQWFRFGVEDWIWKGPRRGTELVADVEAALSTAKVRRRAMAIRANIFIVHGGDTEEDKQALGKTRRFALAIGANPVIVESTPSQGRLVNEQVRERLRGCDCAIILATCDREGNDQSQARENVIHEIGLCQERLGSRLILLLEEGCSLPSNLSGLIYTRFTPLSMDDALIKAAAELRDFGLV